MSLYFQCPYCNSTLEVGDNWNGPEMFCPNCGGKVAIPRPAVCASQVRVVSDCDCGSGPGKSLVAYVLLGVFLGCYGVHDFYAGYTANGVAKLLITLLTCGFGCIVTMIWAIVDICTVRKDASGRPFVA